MREQLAEAISKAVNDLFAVEQTVELTRPDEQFGDFATNVALQLAKQIGKNPREVAEAIKNELTHDVIAGVDVAGPGFLNIKLTDKALIDAINLSPHKTLAGKKVLVEYSDPNPLKPLHAGHLYTTLVGDAIARLVENAGAETIRLNYGGDVGLHVAKNIWAIISELGGELPDKLNEIPNSERSSWLGQRYVEGNNAYEDANNLSPDDLEKVGESAVRLKEGVLQAKLDILAINKRVYELHSSNDRDSAFAQVYWTVRQWSYDYFAKLYDQLGVVAFDRFIPESEVTELGIKTVQEHTGQVYENSDGAVIFDGEKHGLHTRVFINSEGLPTYEAKEVGLLETKWNDYQFDSSIVITANEQDQYMQVVLKSIEQFQPEPVARTKHITHGVVKLAGGVKMSSRKGNIVGALDILEAAHTAGQESGKATEEHVILAAVKYAFLKNRIGSDTVYDPIESVALEGNSGPYLQYAHARARSILAKAGSTEAELREIDTAERSLLRKITEFSEVVEKATNELMPHHICTYLYELAQAFNSFYEHNRVIGDERQATRLGLVTHYADTLKSGLSLLGIVAPERM